MLSKRIFVLFLFFLLTILVTGCLNRTNYDANNASYTKNPSQGVFIAEFSFFELGAKNAAFVGSMDPTLKSRFKELGGTNVFEKKEIDQDWIKRHYNPNTGDLMIIDGDIYQSVFTNLANSIVEKNPDIIFLDNILGDDFSVAENIFLTAKLKEKNFRGKILFTRDGPGLSKYCPAFLTFPGGINIPGSTVDAILYAEKTRSAEEIRTHPWLEFLRNETIANTGFAVFEYKYRGENCSELTPCGCLAKRL